MDIKILSSTFQNTIKHNQGQKEKINTLDSWTFARNWTHEDTVRLLHSEEDGKGWK